jgi:hydrogenase-4 component B
MMAPEQAVFASILACIAGAGLTLLVARNKLFAGWLVFLVTACTAALTASAVWRVLTLGPSVHPVAFWAAPKLGLALRLHVDGLSAAFLLLTGLIALPASFYSIAYMQHYRDYSAARYYPHLLLFIASMYGLLSTTDTMWVFCFFWQLMTFASYFLIRFEYRNRACVRAAYKYLAFMQIACAAAMVGGGLLIRAAGAVPVTNTAKYEFDSVAASTAFALSTQPATAALAFTCFLIGFGIKAGIWPFGQLWIPDAYSAAPSSASAVLSGVMSKTGIYGLMRCFLWLVPQSAQAQYPLAKWGMLIAVLGTITLFTGTMQALSQEDSKRLLAFHSVGQIGYMLLGTGAAMSLLGANVPAATALATIAFFGALLHVFNHGFFKGLLFFNAGSIRRATGSEDLNQLGGLMKFMPLTAITTLIASFSISGVPLFNGFVSKWSIYVASVQGFRYARYLPLCTIIAILTSALTLASFIKFFGVSFLSRTSALVKQRAADQNDRLEVPWTMQLPQFFLALFCILVGIVPALGFRFAQLVLASSPGGFGAILAGNIPMHAAPLTGVMEVSADAKFVPVALAAVLAAMFVLAYGLAKLGRAPRRAAAPWLCGYAREAECHRYIAHNFYGEIKRYFRWLGGTPHHVKHAHGEDLP